MITRVITCDFGTCSCGIRDMFMRNLEPVHVESGTCSCGIRNMFMWNLEHVHVEKGAELQSKNFISF